MNQHNRESSLTTNLLPLQFRQGATLLTGATGFLGRRLLAELNPSAQRPVIALVRADSDDAARERGERINPSPYVLWLCGDLTETYFGWTPELWHALGAAVVEIFHCAGSGQLDLSLAEAQVINVDATARLLKFARTAMASHGKLRRLHYVSSAYRSGKCKDLLAADSVPSDRARNFRNNHERTKARAERLLRAQTLIPVSLYRPSRIAGDSRTRGADQPQALAGVMGWIQRGVQWFAQKHEGSLDRVGVDYVARGIVALACGNHLPQSTFHLTATQDCGILTELLETFQAEAGRCNLARVGFAS